jgi:hypothetical protein
MSNLKKIITTTVRECLNEQNTVDTILDKINKVGIDKLTSFEREILQKSTQYSNIDDSTVNWLNSNYSNLNVFEEKRNSFGRVKEYLVFMNDDMDMEFEYDKSNKKLYISYDDIRNNLGELFNEKSFKKWFSETYDIEILRIGDYFKNVD